MRPRCGPSTAQNFRKRSERRYPDLEAVESRIESHGIRAEWLPNAIDGGERFVAIRRSHPHDTLTRTSVVSEKLLQDRAFIESNVGPTGQFANQCNALILEVLEDFDEI